jgi:hypothetical protein
VIAPGPGRRAGKKLGTPFGPRNGDPLGQELLLLLVRLSFTGLPVGCYFFGMPQTPGQNGVDIGEVEHVEGMDDGLGRVVFVLEIQDNIQGHARAAGANRARVVHVKGNRERLDRDCGHAGHLLPLGLA